MISSNYNISAGILCGGKSARFGEDKSLVRFGELNSIEIAVKELSKLFNGIFIIGDISGKYSYLNLKSINDIYPNSGPLSGILAGLKSISDEYLFVLAVDMPLITSKIIANIIEKINGEDIIYAVSSGKKHYLCGAYSINCVKKIEELFQNNLNSKSPSIYDLICISNIKEVEFFDDIRFANMNAKRDYYEILNIYKSSK